MGKSTIPDQERITEGTSGEFTDTGVSGEQTTEIAQVLPLEDGAIAVLYSNGSVAVSGNAEFSQAVSDWSNVTCLYYDRYFPDDGGPALLGLTENGSVLATEGDFSDWSNVIKLYFSEGIVALTDEGKVLTYGIQGDDSYLTGLSNVDELVYSDIQGIWGCLKKDGSVYFCGPYLPGSNTDTPYWNNVKELRDSGHAFYAIMNDGTVDGQLGSSFDGLRDAKKILHYQDWLLGVSADGRLLTQNNGNIYTYSGILRLDVPGCTEYGIETDISQYDQIEDIQGFWGLVLLNKDGTVDFIGEKPEWNFSDWDNIEKILCYSDFDGRIRMLYGIRQDGSVIMNRYHCEEMVETVTDQYQGWKLRDIFPGYGGVVGLTLDGKLVGDGIYENADFSAFHQ